MSRQYLREAKLKVTGKEFGGRIAFEIKKGEHDSTTCGVRSNKSTVSIYNLSEDSRDTIEREVGTGVMALEAGYRDALSTIFIGDIAYVDTKRNGPDIVITIEAGDGERQLVKSNINLSLGAGANDAQILNAAIKSLNLPRGNIATQKMALTYNNGFAYSGLSSDLIDQIAKKLGLAWSVQNGALQIRDEGTPIATMPILLTDQTGLISISSKRADNLKAECLLNPELEPGRLVKIESAFQGINATWIVKSVEHAGDTHGDQWKSTIWGQQL